MTIEDRKNLIRKNIVWEPVNEKTGGQTCNMFPLKCILYSPDLEMRIEVGCFSSNMKNKEQAMKLFEITLYECVR